MAYPACVVNDGKTICQAFEGHCTQPDLCPLSQVKAGSIVCIKQLDAAPEVTHRLRELGLREEQQIRLVSRQSTYICQVCNARLGISEQLAENILVQPLPATQPALEACLPPSNP